MGSAEGRGGLVIADGHNFPCPCWGLSGLQSEDEIGTVFSSSPSRWVMLGTLILKDERGWDIHHNMLQRLRPVRLIVCLRGERERQRNKKALMWGKRAAGAISHLCFWNLSGRPTVYVTAWANISKATQVKKKNASVPDEPNSFSCVSVIEQQKTKHRCGTLLPHGVCCSLKEKNKNKKKTTTTATQ